MSGQDDGASNLITDTISECFPAGFVLINWHSVYLHRFHRPCWPWLKTRFYHFSNGWFSRTGYWKVLALLDRGLIGELGVRRQHIHTWLKPLSRPIKAKFHVKSPWVGGKRMFLQVVVVICHISYNGKKALKSFSSEQKQLMRLKFGIYYQVSPFKC